MLKQFIFCVGNAVWEISKGYGFHVLKQKNKLLIIEWTMSCLTMFRQTIFYEDSKTILSEIYFSEECNESGTIV